LERNAMFVKYACRAVVLLGVLCVAGILARPAGAQAIRVSVVQVLASNRGEAHVDPALGALGAKLQKRYPYRNYRKVGSSTRSGNVGRKLQFALNGGMTLGLDLLGYRDPVVSMRATVTRGATRIVGMDLSVPKGRCTIISVPLGADTLILAITPTTQ